ncbi:phage tail-like protein [Phycicoccus badiiscoriae]|uniref:Phage tail-like protein n=1 Tax=Pedococcus badiiscoriae TaxID=642776 RepID=A0A852WPP1_9MICO|nr:phage tail protein [Pedococcus badiiscoriae]NYG07212.1 phage tail-like protein [Pedococcus badiiscoriae]
MAAHAGPLEGSNFIVDFAGTDDASFSHVELPVAHIDEIAYRPGNDRSNEPHKQPGLASYSHLVLSRGLSANLDLWTWWEGARDGDPAVDRTVVVKLLDATDQLVLTWQFRNAFPAVYRLSPLDAASSDIVIETVELAFDSMDVEVP